MKTELEKEMEAPLIYRAKVIDTISRETIEAYAFNAANDENARELAWKRAGRYGGDVFVSVTGPVRMR